MTTISHEVAVVGAGPAGLASALALAHFGLDVAVAAPPPAEGSAAPADPRTTALLASSLEMLRNLGVWQRCCKHAAALEGVRIVDDRGGLLRAPEVLFRAGELGLPAFGANIANRALGEALLAAARDAASLVWRPTAGVLEVTPRPACVRLRLAEGGSLEARLVVAADGRNSRTRAAAGIPVGTWSYPQAAIATTFRHTRPHGAVTTELHRRAGPLTTVPLPGLASSLVWVEDPAEARRLACLPEAPFLAELGARLQGLLGALSEVGPRALYPLSGLSAHAMGGGRIALVGEAAHVIPPIGAQGLNLGLRDAAALADCVREARAQGADVGGPAVLAAYGRARAADVLARTLSVDLLNRSLLLDLLPAQALRGLGLHALANIAPLRRLVMQGGLGAIGALPSLMRPAAASPAHLTSGP